VIATSREPRPHRGGLAETVRRTQHSHVSEGVEPIE
jgi:hypothetical protein